MTTRSRNRRERALSERGRFEDIVAEHGGMLWRSAVAYEADPQLRQDLYQEILLAVWRALPRLREPAMVRTYLARIAHNRGVSHVQGQLRLPRAAELDPELLTATTPDPERQVELADDHERLLQAIERLPVAWRQVVTLTLEAFSPGEIAEVLGVPVNVVSIRLTRAKPILRTLMEDDGR